MLNLAIFTVILWAIQTIILCFFKFTNRTTWAHFNHTPRILHHRTSFRSQKLIRCHLCFWCVHEIHVIRWHLCQRFLKRSFLWISWWLRPKTLLLLRFLFCHRCFFSRKSKVWQFMKIHLCITFKTRDSFLKSYRIKQWMNLFFLFKTNLANYVTT